MPVYTGICPYWGARGPETPERLDTSQKNEIGIDSGNKFPPPLIFSSFGPKARNLFSSGSPGLQG